MIGRSACGVRRCGAEVSAPIFDIRGVRFVQELDGQVYRYGGSEADVMGRVGG